MRAGISSCCTGMGDRIITGEMGSIWSRGVCDEAVGSVINWKDEGRESKDTATSISKKCATLATMAVNLNGEKGNIQIGNMKAVGEPNKVGVITKADGNSTTNHDRSLSIGGNTTEQLVRGVLVKKQEQRGNMSTDAPESGQSRLARAETWRRVPKHQAGDKGGAPTWQAEPAKQGWKWIITIEVRESFIWTVIHSKVGEGRRIGVVSRRIRDTVDLVFVMGGSMGNRWGCAPGGIGYSRESRNRGRIGRGCAGIGSAGEASQTSRPEPRTPGGMGAVGLGHDRGLLTERGCFGVMV